MNRVFGLTVSAISMLSCFFSSPQWKRLVGEYCLQQGPGEGYAVVGCSSRATLRGRTDNGPMDGNALAVGWDDRLIVAKRVAVLGGSEGWMILDAKADTLEGPFTDDEFASKKRGSAQLAAIYVWDVESAWTRLR